MGCNSVPNLFNWTAELVLPRDRFADPVDARIVADDVVERIHHDHLFHNIFAIQTINALNGFLAKKKKRPKKIV